jgi:hypothetical protein
VARSAGTTEHTYSTEPCGTERCRARTHAHTRTHMYARTHAYTYARTHAGTHSFVVRRCRSELGQRRRRVELINERRPKCNLDPHSDL